MLTPKRGGTISILFFFVFHARTAHQWIGESIDVDILRRIFQSKTGLWQIF